MGLGSRGRAVDASGWLTLRRDRLFFSEPRYASASDLVRAGTSDSSRTLRDLITLEDPMWTSTESDVQL